MPGTSFWLCLIKEEEEASHKVRLLAFLMAVADHPGSFKRFVEQMREQELEEMLEAEQDDFGPAAATVSCPSSQLREANAELREHLAAKTACWRIDLPGPQDAEPALWAVLSRSFGDTPRAQVSKANDSLFVVPTPVRLSNRMLNTIRTKIKTAAYEGPRAFRPQGHGFDVMFNRFDQDGSGSLTAREVRRALRRSLRIPEGTLSDQQIISLCAWLDIDGSGLVEIDDLVAFLSVEPQIEPPRLKSTVELEGQASNRSFELDCFVTPRRSQATQTRSKAPPLSKGLLSTLRSKMKAASYAGHLGCDLKALFSRFDHTGTGVLEEEQLRQVIRRAMRTSDVSPGLDMDSAKLQLIRRIAPSVISDAQIAKLCTMLDKEALGAIGIDTLVDFVSKDPERGGRRELGHMAIEAMSVRASRHAAALRRITRDLQELDAEPLELAVLGAMAARQRLQELFEKYDTSGDGTLSEEEMAKVFQALNIKKEKVEAMFKAADSDQDGVIQVHEFISWLTARGVSIKILKEREARKRKRAKHSEFAL
eukprot:g3528.t3